jgi:hypothetical protein
MQLEYHLKFLQEPLKLRDNINNLNLMIFNEILNDAQST